MHRSSTYSLFQTDSSFCSNRLLCKCSENVITRHESLPLLPHGQGSKSKPSRWASPTHLHNVPPHSAVCQEDRGTEKPAACGRSNCQILIPGMENANNLVVIIFRGHTSVFFSCMSPAENAPLTLSLPLWWCRLPLTRRALGWRAEWLNPEKRERKYFKSWHASQNKSQHLSHHKKLLEIWPKFEHLIPHGCNYILWFTWAEFQACDKSCGLFSQQCFHHPSDSCWADSKLNCSVKWKWKIQTNRRFSFGKELVQLYQSLANSLRTQQICLLHLLPLKWKYLRTGQRDNVFLEKMM